MSPSTIEPRSPMLRKATIGNSFSFSLKKVRAIRKGKAQNFFQCKSCLFAEVSNRSHAGKAVAKFNVINYNYNLSKLSACHDDQTLYSQGRGTERAFTIVISAPRDYKTLIA